MHLPSLPMLAFVLLLLVVVVTSPVWLKDEVALHWQPGLLWAVQALLLVVLAWLFGFLLGLVIWFLVRELLPRTKRIA